MEPKCMQIEQLRMAGLVRGGSLENALVCSMEGGLLNPPLRKVWEVIVVDSKMQGSSSASLRDLSGEESSASSFVETTYVWNLLGKMQQSLSKQFLRKFEQYWFPSYDMGRPKVFDLVAVEHCIYLSIDVSSS